MGWGLISCCLLAPSLYALDVQVGRSFKITNIKRTEGHVVLPIERKKYYNIRILQQETLHYVQNCTEPCIQSREDTDPQLHEIRLTQTRPDMWIAHVSFGRAWLVTFLVFKKGTQVDVKPPSNFIFLDAAFKHATYQIVVQAVRQEEK